ncbi:MAG: maltose ABC transporter permease MalF [Dictyoglomus sp. NZ13-RE01]|nr:MAG: maltose ABC transporter permease MalF [Dictyoglomus sp. NZ13-RE01]
MRYLWRNIFVFLYASLIAGVGIFFSYILSSIAGFIFGLVTFLITLFFVFLIIHPKFNAWKYIVPAFMLMVIFMIYPIIYTIRIAFTNYGTGHILTKEQVVEQLEKETFTPADSKNYIYEVYVNKKGEIKLLFQDEEENVYIVKDNKLISLGVKNFPNEIDGFTKIPSDKKFSKLSEVQKLEYHLENGIVLKMSDLLHFSTLRQRYKYIPEEDALYDYMNNEKLVAKNGFFVRSNGEELLPGFVEDVGWENFKRLIKDERVSKPFFRVFSWTVIWAGVTTLLNFAVGLGLALLMSDKNLRFKSLYRTLLIVPWAIPAFISLLIWVGLLNQEVGVVNRILNSIIGVKIPWFLDTFWARVALFIVNLWLGFPYMMTVCLGALQSIPDELYEASKVDGATPRQQFWNITLPLLLTAIGPLLVGSFSFNFNNFNVIYLLTAGRPPMADVSTVAGTTDILISYTYKLAFEGGRGQDYGLAATISIIVFLIIATISVFNFWISGMLKREVRFE